MSISNINTIEQAAYGAVSGAIYGALLNPSVGIVAASVIGAVSFAGGSLLNTASIAICQSTEANLAFEIGLRNLREIQNGDEESARLVSNLILGVDEKETAAHSIVNFVRNLVISISMTIFGIYAGLHVSNTALTALGFLATFEPSASLALKVFLTFVLAKIIKILATMEDD